MQQYISQKITTVNSSPHSFYHAGVRYLLSQGQVDQGLVRKTQISLSISGDPDYPKHCYNPDKPHSRSLEYQPNICFRHTRTADERWKERGIVREFQIGHRHFDDQVFIDSPTPDFLLEDILSEEPVREAILSLLADWTEVRLLTPNAIVELSGVDPEHLTVTEKHLELMKIIRDLLPSVTVQKPKHVDNGYLLEVFNMMAFLGSLFFLALGNDHYTLYAEWGWLTALGIGIILWAAAMIMMIRSVRKRSDSLRQISRNAMWLTWIMIASIPLFRFVNAKLDYSPVQQLDVAVIDHRTKKATSTERSRVEWVYFITVEDSEHSPAMEFRVSYHVFVETQRRPIIRLPVHKGALGIPWIEDGVLQREEGE